MHASVQLARGAATALGMLAFCSLAMPAVAQDDEFDITFIIYTTPGDIYWAPVIKGAEEAAEHFGVNLDIQYSNNDPVKQNDIIETAITNEVEGIGLGLFVENSFRESIQKARDADIGVIVFDTDDPGGAQATARQAYVGEDLVFGGETLARYVINEFGLKQGDHTFCPAEYPEATYAVKRYEGVMNILEPLGVTCELTPVGGTFEDALPAMTQYLIGHPETVAVIAIGGTPTAMAPQAIAEAGLEIPNGGFDLNQVITANIAAGKTFVTLDQRPYFQGYWTVMQLYHYKAHGIEPVDIPCGAAIVNASNVEFASEWAGVYR